MDSLTLMDMSDVEILHVAYDVLDHRDTMTTADVARGLGFSLNGAPGRVARRSTGIRLGWMGRWGVVERIGPAGKAGSRWRITSRGRAAMNSSLKAAQGKALANLNSDELIPAMRAMATRYRAADRTGATLARREFQRGIAL